MTTYTVKMWIRQSDIVDKITELDGFETEELAQMSIMFLQLTNRSLIQSKIVEKRNQ